MTPPQPNQSPTPRTDAETALWVKGLGKEHVTIDFARTLERELNEAKNRLAELTNDQSIGFWGRMAAIKSTEAMKSKEQLSSANALIEKFSISSNNLIEGVLEALPGGKLAAFETLSVALGGAIHLAKEYGKK